jgi:hypothetical protein
MIRFFRLIVLALLVANNYSQEVNIAVLDLDPTGISVTESQFLSDRLRTELFETGVFQVVERQKMNSILQEQGFQNTGCTSLECAVEIGQLLNVKQMVAGSIGKIEDIYSISLRLINVQTGAITKTATRDYEGKLSSVLTDVIPEVAQDLSINLIEEGDVRITADTEQQLPVRNNMSGDKSFALFIKGGLVFLGYPDDLNSAADEVRELQGIFLEDAPRHSNFGFELRYVLSERVSLKAGITQLSMASNWRPKLDNYNTNTGAIDVDGQFERTYTFTNSYLGINYDLWRVSESSVFYLGTDIGGMTMQSELIQRFQLSDGTEQEYDKGYSYSAFTFKLLTGLEYMLSSKFSLSAEFVLQSVEPFNTSEEERNDLFPQELDPLVFPDEINAAGIQLNILIGYYF